MRTDIAQPVRLSDYRPSDYLIDAVDLDIRLHLSATHVRARLAIRPNPMGRPGAPLVLDGDGLNATMVLLDGGAMDLSTLSIGPDRLTIAEPPRKAFELTIDTTVDPSANTQLMGLYRSGSAYCTQCEAEGFRRITYFLDRPDVLSIYTTRIEAEKAQAPVLLGNGNLVENGDLPGSARHYAVWHDPHPKPCYLFALVGGDLGSIHDTFTTQSGREVRLGIYVEHGKEPRAAYAMDALKRSMRWDEEAFGREYDLDVFNIVAVSDFNMGAMENKGLNVFNDKYVLALPQTATDLDYAHIEGVIAHEYFHNWTGNRITCRDWFQLCLKEGLTVFRDQEFSSDQRSRPVKRIADIRTLRAAQFPEDSGPLAHNVRPETYLEINNFYTPTIYEKGAEVIRMLKSLIGVDAFRKGMDLYFDRCDGTAATGEDFIACFAEVSGRDLTQFMRWYSQAGTPALTVTSDHDASAKTFTLTISQSTPRDPRGAGPCGLWRRSAAEHQGAGRGRRRQRARMRQRRLRINVRLALHRVPQCRGTPGALGSARLLRTREARHRLERGGLADPSRTRQRSVQPLAGHTDSGDALADRFRQRDPRRRPSCAGRPLWGGAGPPARRLRRRPRLHRAGDQPSDRGRHGPRDWLGRRSGRHSHGAPRAAPESRRTIAGPTAEGLRGALQRYALFARRAQRRRKGAAHRRA